MPIDSGPEGGEIMHQPGLKPFPEKAEQAGKAGKDDEDDRVAKEAEDLAAARLSAENQRRAVAQEELPIGASATEGRRL